MHLTRYPARVNESHETYEFLSSGPKGTIRKVVKYTEIDPGIFNLAFGDWNEKDKAIKDNIRTNNADRDKVLATVASTVVDFIQHHPGVMVFAQGESAAKTRLYQMSINANWHEINLLFTIQGFKNGVWEYFDRSKNYEAFILMAR